MAELTVKEAINIIINETINEGNIERYNQAIETIESAKARILLVATECEDKLNEIKDDEQYIETKQWIDNFEDNFDKEAAEIQSVLKDLGAMGINLKDKEIIEYENYLKRVNSLYNGLKRAVAAYQKAPNNIFSRNFSSIGIKRYQYYKTNKGKLNLVKEKVEKLNEKANEREQRNNIYAEYCKMQDEVKKIYAEKMKKLSEKLGIDFNTVKKIITMKIPEKFNGKEYLKNVEEYIKDGGDPNVLDFDLITSVAKKEISSLKNPDQITFEDAEMADVNIEEPYDIDRAVDAHDYNDEQNR